MQRGQVVVMFALMLSGLAAVSALGIDALQLLAQRRALQGAADLSALAGGQELWATEKADAATKVALFIATANGYSTGTKGVTVSVVTPYKDDPSSIEVTIRQAADTLFLRVLGIPSVEVMGRAVGSPSGYAVFAGATDCPDWNTLNFGGKPDWKTLDFTSNDVTITGRVHSNGWIKVAGSGNRLGIATRRCDDWITGSNNYFPGAKPRPTSKRPWPINYTPADFPCTFTFSGNTKLKDESAVWLDWPANTQLRPGVYCSTGDLDLQGGGVSGNVTFVATGLIHLSGSNFNLTAYAKNVLLFSTASGNRAVQISSSAHDGRWTGTLYAPNGEVQMNGARNRSDNGSIVAAAVAVTTNELVLKGNVGPPGGLLVE